MRCLVTIVAVSITATTYSAHANSLLNRDLDPLIIQGADLPAFLGELPGVIVGFAYDGSWVQIPVQVDERHWVDFGTVYNQAPIGLLTLAYADADTFTGSDPDPLFDGDDELAIMAADAGGRSLVGDPPGVVPGSRLEVRITDPLEGGVGYVYLFVSDGSLVPGAGVDYVNYSFNLLSGDYKTTYNTMAGPNPENSLATSSEYSTHFADRWIRDGLRISAGNATSVDILDRHKSMFAPGNCVRTENTFSNGEGAFFANIDGSVRAIRSYMGANSGPLTQRDHFFYSHRQKLVTHLRVHAISSLLDAYDYSPDATGMTYYDSLNPTGVIIDGVPDAVTTGPLEWQLVTGPQGSLTMALAFETDITPFSPTSFYSDDVTPSFTQCTGDAFEYAMSGPFVNHAIPNTDPTMPDPRTLVVSRVVYYEPPGSDVATAALRALEARTPLTWIAETAAPGDINADGSVDIVDVDAFLNVLLGTPLAPEHVTRADMNGDGPTDGRDAQPFVTLMTN